MAVGEGSEEIEKGVEMVVMEEEVMVVVIMTNKRRVERNLEEEK
jgi:hypothetical protein